MSSSLRELPSVDQVLDTTTAREMLDELRREYVVDVVRSILQDMRERLLGSGEKPVRGDLLREIEDALRLRIDAGAQPSLRRVTNATGIILHTGLGRAPLPDSAVEAITDLATHYCNLEMDLDSAPLMITTLVAPS